jgi:hypothetical protein
MKRELAIILSVLAIVSAFATILSAPLWVFWGCFLILCAFTAFLLGKRLIGHHPLPYNPVITDGPYTVFPADESDIRWAAEQAKKVYMGIDIISQELMLEWFNANPNGFFVVKDRHGHRCGNIDILPLRPDTFKRFLAGELIEQDIRGDSLFHPDETEHISDLYVESVVVVNANREREGNPYAVQRIILSVPVMLSGFCSHGNLAKIYAVGGSNNGIKLMRHLGFDMISGGDGRKDKHKVFVTGIEDLIRNIAVFAGSPEERDRFLQLVSKGGDQTL